MSEWFLAFQYKMAANYSLVLGRIVDCDLADRMRLLAVVFILLWVVRLMAHGRALRRMRRECRDLNPSLFPAIWMAYRNAASRMKLRVLPPLLESGRLALPVFTTGTLRPCVFFHPRLAEDLSPTEMEAAFTHELVHVARKDHLLFWALELGIAALPLMALQFFAGEMPCSPHSQAWVLGSTALAVMTLQLLLHRMVRPLREHSCDDRTVQYTRKPLDLASSLLKTWRFIRESAVSGVSFPRQGHLYLTGGASLESRVRRLLDYQRPYFRQAIGLLAKAAVAVGGLLILLFLYRFHLTDSYRPSESFCRAQSECVQKSCSLSGTPCP